MYSLNYQTQGIAEVKSTSSSSRSHMWKKNMHSHCNVGRGLVAKLIVMIDKRQYIATPKASAKENDRRKKNILNYKIPVGVEKGKNDGAVGK